MSVAEKLQTIAENEQKVYEAGKQAEYDAFWKAFWKDLRYYDNSAQVYMYTMYNWFGIGWNKDNFKPIYPNETIYCTSATRTLNMFNRGAYYNTELIDLTEFCQHINFSKAKSANYTFEDARAKNITVDFSNATTLLGTFGCGNGGGFENVLVKVSDKCTTFTGFTQYDYHITNFKFTEDSVIAANISFNHNRKLNKESLTSIVNALSPTASGKTATFSKTAVDTAFETAEGLGDGSTSAEWLALIATKPNWTISLV